MLKRAVSGPVDNWTLSLDALQSRRWLSCHISCYFCPGCVVITTPNACAVSNSELQWGSIITQSILCSIPSTENTWVTCEAGYGIFITMTSLWARLCLKSPASRLFTQPVIQGTDTKYQSSVSLAFVRGIHRSPVNSPHKGPVTQKTYLFFFMYTG